MHTTEEITVTIPTAEKTKKNRYSRTCRSLKNIVVNGNA